MKILVYSLHYYPDLIGIAKYNTEMCEWLAMQNHEVELITGKGFYPEWKLKQVNFKWGFCTEYVNNVKIYRNPIYVPGKPSAFKKVFHELSFAVTSVVSFALKAFKQYDLVIVVCPPFHLGLFALLYGKLKKIPVLYHVQDLQVDIAKDLNFLKGKFLFNLLYKLEYYILSKVALISTVSEGMKQKIFHKNIPSNKIILFPNWVDTNFIKPLSKSESLRERFGYDMNDFIVLYSGNMGEKQGLEIVINTAEFLKDNLKIKFVMVGEGSSRNRLEDAAIEKGLKNIRFFALQPYHDLPLLLAMADIHLVLQKKSASDLVLPSKLTGILSAGGVAIVTAVEHSYLFQEMKQHNLGVIIEPENSQSLLEAIQVLITDMSSVKMYQQNALRYAKEYLNKEVILSRFETILENLVKNAK